MKMLVILLAFAGTQAMAFENNCRVAPNYEYTDLIIDGVAVEHFTYPQEAYNILTQLRSIGACKPSRCQIGAANTANALKVEDTPVEFTGSLGESMAAFTQWQDQHICDDVPSTTTSAER